MIKTILLVSLLLFMPFALFARITEQQWAGYGNYYYKQKQYNKAVYAYDNALKINPDNTTALTFGGYAYIYLKNIQAGISYLDRAFRLTNNAALGTQINKLRTYYAAHNAKATAAAPQNESVFKWILIGADAGLAAWATFSYLDFNKAAGDYDSTYKLINNTTMANYYKLVDMKNAAEGKQTMSGVLAFLAGSAVAYTLADIFLIHAAFPVKTEIDIKDRRVKVALKKEF
jgi:tetratricopeptide (TPR) repeat protein